MLLEDLLQKNATFLCCQCGAVRVCVSVAPPNTQCPTIKGSCVYTRMKTAGHLPPEAQTSLLTHILQVARKAEHNQATQDAAMNRVLRLYQETKGLGSVMTNKQDRDLMDRAGAAMSQLLLSRGYRVDGNVLRTVRPTSTPPVGENSWSDWLFT